MPPKRYRRLAFARGKLEPNLRLERIALFIDAGTDCFNFGWVTELERAERHVCGVTRHITKRTGAEILPPAPVPRMIDAVATTTTTSARGRVAGPRSLVWTLRCRAEPKVPVERIGNGIFAGGPVHALRPDGPVSPDIDLANRADDASLNDFNGASQPIFGAALVAHLRCDFVFFCQPAQQSRFINGLGQWFLAINVFAHFHRRCGNGGVEVIRCGKDDRVERFLGLEHFSKIFVRFGAWMPLVRASQGVSIYIAECDNIFAGAGLQV